MSASNARSDEIDLASLWDAVWLGRYIVLVVTAVFAIAAVVYALLAQPIFRAEVVLVHAGEKNLNGPLRDIGGLASLAGITFSSGNNAQEPLAVLKSKDFARQFITDFDLMRLLLEKKAKAGKPLDIRDAVEILDNNIRFVIEDKKTGLVTLAVQWGDSEVAAEWANEMVRRLNDRLRNQALKESERNIQFLRKEIGTTEVVSLQQSLGRVLESEMQKYMLARGNEEFAFKVIDRATPPKQRYWPRRAQIVTVATIAGGFLSVLISIFWHFVIRNRRARQVVDPRDGDLGPIEKRV